MYMKGIVSLRALSTYPYSSAASLHTTMALEKQTYTHRRLLQTRGSRIITGVIVVIAILAIVIPTAVVVSLRKKSDNMGPKSTVFVPLYVYPAPGAWTPLEEVYVMFSFSLDTPH